MSKIENITPEERENALALIRKCGLEETEKNINYYVRMQRESKKHREEKENPPENNSNNSIGKFFVGGILVALFLMIKMCGGCNSCSEYGDVRSESITELKHIIEESGKISEDEAKCLVVHFILNHMKDPNSYESVSWGPLNKTQEIDGEGGGWNIKHTFRGPKSYGAYVTETHIYIIHKDGWVTTF